MARLCFVGLLLFSLPQAFAAGRNFTVMFNEDTYRISSPTNLFSSNLLSSAEIYWVKGPSGVLTLYAAPGIITNRTEKASPVAADTLLVVDSEDGGALKMVQVGNLPGGGGGEANIGTTIGSGAMFFAGKTGVTLQFVAATNTTGRMTITTNGSQMLFDVVEAGLDIANLGGTLASTDLSDTAALARITDLTTSSNALRTLFLASDITTSNALITLLNTKVDTNATSALGTNWITNVEDIGAPDAGDMIPIVDISTATRKYVTASQLTGVGGSGTVTHTAGALTLDQPLLGAGGDDIKTSTIGNFLTVLSVPTHAELVTVSNTLNTLTISNTLYVTKGGSDTTGNGSIGAPWATITNAITRSQSNQVIRIGPGHYNLGVSARESSLKFTNTALTLIGDGRDSTVIYGSDTIEVTIVKAGTGAIVSLKDLSLIGTNAQQSAIETFDGAIVTIENCLLYGLEDGMFVADGSRVDVYSSVIKSGEDPVTLLDTVAAGTVVNLFSTHIRQVEPSQGTLSHGLYTLTGDTTIRMFGGRISQELSNGSMVEYYGAYNNDAGTIELHGVKMDGGAVANELRIGNPSGTIRMNGVDVDHSLVSGNLTWATHPTGWATATNAGMISIANGRSGGTNLFRNLLATNGISLHNMGSYILVSNTLSAASGEANVNGEVSLTNHANGIFGLVYDKQGVTNRIKSISEGANILIDPQGTNIQINVFGLQIGSDVQGFSVNLSEWAGISTNKVAFTNSPWFTTMGSNGVVVAAGANIGVVSAGSGGQQTFTVSVNDAELLEWAGISTNKFATTNHLEIQRAATNNVRVVGGTGGITVAQAISGGVSTWTVNDDDAGAVGDVSGPGSSLDNNVPRWNGTGGDTLQSSHFYINDTGGVLSSNAPGSSEDLFRVVSTNTPATTIFGINSNAMFSLRGRTGAIGTQARLYAIDDGAGNAEWLQIDATNDTARGYRFMSDATGSGAHRSFTFEPFKQSVGVPMIAINGAGASTRFFELDEGGQTSETADNGVFRIFSHGASGNASGGIIDFENPNATSSDDVQVRIWTRLLTGSEGQLTIGVADDTVLAETNPRLIIDPATFRVFGMLSVSNTPTSATNFFQVLGTDGSPVVSVNSNGVFQVLGTGSTSGSIDLYETSGANYMRFTVPDTIGETRTNVFSPGTNAASGHVWAFHSVDAAGTRVVWTNAVDATSAGGVPFNFNPNQLTTNANFLSIIDGALLTNINIRTALTMPTLTASRVAVVSGNNEITNSTVTTTTLGYLDATSSIQTQIDGNDTDISNLQGATNGLLTRVNNLDGATNGITTRLNNHDTDISNLQSRTNFSRLSVTNHNSLTNYVVEDNYQFTIYDSFNRPNTSPGTMTASPSGVTWLMDQRSLGTTATNNGYIRNGRFVADMIPTPDTNNNSTVYLKSTTYQPTTLMGAKIIHRIGNTIGGQLTGFTMNFSSDPSWSGRMIHVGFDRDGANTFITTNGVGASLWISSVGYPAIATNDTVIDLSAEYLGNNMIRISVNGTNRIARHAWIDGIMSSATNQYWQISRAQTNNATDIELEAVYAGHSRSIQPLYNTNQFDISTNGTGVYGLPVMFIKTNGLDASVLGSGTVATARLGSGTANGSTFLRGDQTWATPAGAGTMTSIKENDVAVGGADIVTLDFLGADFDLTESPDTEIQVVIAAALTRDTEWDTSAKIWTAVTDETGTGGALVFAQSPLLSGAATNAGTLRQEGSVRIVGKQTNDANVIFGGGVHVNSPLTNSAIARFQDTVTFEAGADIISSDNATFVGLTAGSVTVSNTVTITSLKHNIWTNYVNTASNFVFSFNTNYYEFKNQTNVVFTNLVEEATAVNSKIVAHVHNTTGVSMGLVWPAYGAQHGYYFHTNANNAILSLTTLASGSHGVFSLECFGTNLFPTWTVWP